MVKKKQTKKKKDNHIVKNIIYIISTIFIIYVIFIISNNTNKKDNNGLFTFDTSSFSNITAIGVSEYEASLNYDGQSVIFVCSNESKDCYNMLEHLNDIGKKNNINIEYLNVLELVEEEKNLLTKILPKYAEKDYPFLNVLNADKSIIFDEFLEKDTIEEILKENKIIK